MTQRTTPLILSLFPLLVMACQPGDVDSEGPSGIDTTDDIDVFSESVGVLNASPELASIDPSHQVGFVIDDTSVELSTALECATQVFHYDFDGMPESIRVQLKRSGDQIDFAYQYANVHSNTPGSTISGPWDVAGVAVGEWDENTILLSMNGTDTIGMGDFEMGLSRDPRVSGDVYVGYGSLGGGSFGIEMSCWDADLEPDFLYDGDTGTCTNAAGETGTNPWPIHMVRESLDGECANLSSMMLNEDDYSHADLVGWNLRGAVLSGSTLHFTNLVDAELEGADLSRLEYGYADITGTTDLHTQLPIEGCSLGETGDLYCRR